MIQHPHFGDKVRELRTLAGWSQDQLAAVAGFSSRSSVVSTERDGAPRAEVARGIIDALKTSPKLLPYWWQLDELAELLALSPAIRAGRDDPLIVGLVIPSFAPNQGWTTFAGEIETHAAQAGHLYTSCQHHNRYDLCFASLARFEECGRLAGIIVVLPPWKSQREIARRTTGELTEVVARLTARGVGLVCVDRRPPASLDVPFVGIDNDKAIDDAIRLLVRQGHQRIGGLFGAQDEGSPHRERLAAYESALSRRRLPPDTRLVRCLISDNADGVRAAQELIELPAEIRPTAVVCTTYLLTIAVVEAVNRRRAVGLLDLEIPRTLSVVGFDNTAARQLGQAKITRVHYDVRELAKEALRQALPPSADETTAPARVPPSFRIRIAEGDSVAPPPA